MAAVAGDEPHGFVATASTTNGDPYLLACLARLYFQEPRGVECGDDGRARPGSFVRLFAGKTSSGAQRPLAVVDETDHFRLRHCLAEDVALPDIAALAKEIGELGIFLDPFDGSLEVEAAA